MYQNVRGRGRARRPYNPNRDHLPQEDREPERESTPLISEQAESAPIMEKLVTQPLTAEPESVQFIVYQNVRGRARRPYNTNRVNLAQEDREPERESATLISGQDESAPIIEKLVTQPLIDESESFQFIVYQNVRGRGRYRRHNTNRVNLAQEDREPERDQRDVGLDTCTIQRDTGLHTCTGEQDASVDTGTYQRDAGLDNGTGQRDAGIDTGTGIDNGTGQRDAGIDTGTGIDNGTGQRDAGIDTGTGIDNGTGQRDAGIDTGTTQRDAGLDTRNEQRDANLNSGIGQRDAGLDNGTGHRDAGLDYANEQRDASVDYSNEQRDASLDTGIGQQDAGLDTGTGQRDASLDTGTHQRDAGLDNGAGQRDAGLDNGTGQRDAGLDTGTGQRDAGLDTVTGRERGGLHHQHHNHLTLSANSYPPPLRPHTFVYSYPSRHQYNHHQQSYTYAHSYRQNYSTRPFMNSNLAHYNNSRHQLQSSSSSNSTRYSNSFLNSIPQTVISATRAATTVISGQYESATIIEHLMTQPFIAFDCEGHTGKLGQLSTVQIGTPDGKAFIFDIIKSPGLVLELKDLLESENIIKVIQDCRGDSEHFYVRYDITLNNVFDTQCAYTFSEEESGRIAKNNIGLNELCETYGVEVNHFKDGIKQGYKRNPRLWLKRPMTQEMILYAASDVLTVTNLYIKLKDKVSESEHFKLLCTERINYHLLSRSDKEDIKSREYSRRFRIRRTIKYNLAMEDREKREDAQIQNEASKSDHEDEASPKTS